jgi:hypothetical protein
MGGVQFGREVFLLSYGRQKIAYNGKAHSHYDHVGYRNLRRMSLDSHLIVTQKESAVTEQKMFNRVEWL